MALSPRLKLLIIRIINNSSVNYNNIWTQTIDNNTNTNESLFPIKISALLTMKITSVRGELTLNKPTNTTLASFKREWYRKWNRVGASITCVLIFLMLIGIVLKSIWNERQREQIQASHPGWMVIVRSSPQDQYCSVQKCNVNCNKTTLNYIDWFLNSTEFLKSCPESIQVKLIIRESQLGYMEPNWLSSNTKLELHTLIFEGVYGNDVRIQSIKSFAFSGRPFYRLKFLTFQFVQIDLIETEAFVTPDLMELSYRDTSLLSVERHHSRTFDRLTTLQFHKSITYEILYNMTASTIFPDLQIVDLRNAAGITKLNSEIFQNMKFLRVLNLNSGVNLKIIEGSTFKFNPHLTELSLQECNLEMLTEDIFGYEVGRNLTFRIDKNPWICNCSLLWLKQTWVKTNIQEVPICNNPLENSGLSFFEAEFCEMVPLPPTEIETTTFPSGNLEQITFNCLNHENIRIRNSDIEFENKPRIDFKLQETDNGKLMVRVEDSINRQYTVFWINNNRKLLIDESSAIIYDAHNQSGCLTGILEPSIVLPQLLPQNAYTVCMIDASESQISPIDCKAITLRPESRYQAWLHKKDRKFVLIYGTVGTVFILGFGTSIGIMISKRILQTKVPRVTLRPEMVHRGTQRRFSDSTVYSSEYVLPMVPSARELLQWKMDRLRDERNQIPPPLPPHPLERISPNLNIERTQSATRC